MSTVTPLPVSTQDAVRREVNIWVMAQKPFTAFNISRALRNRNALSVREYHSALRDYIHELFYHGAYVDYVRTLIDVPGGLSAWLYHHVTTDPNTYDPDAVEPLEPLVVANDVKNASVSVKVTSIPVAKLDKKTNVRAVSTDGRFRFPVSAVHTAGWNAGDKLYVSVTPTEISVFEVKPSNVTAKPVTVDQYGNILVKADANTPAGTQFTVFSAPSYVYALKTSR